MAPHTTHYYGQYFVVKSDSVALFVSVHVKLKFKMDREKADLDESKRKSQSRKND